MPGISDPGSALIAAARAARRAGGGAARARARRSASRCCPGFRLRRFTFEGFPPRDAAARRERFGEALRSGATTIWYESPHRLRASLADLARGRARRASLRRSRIHQAPRAAALGNAAGSDRAAARIRCAARSPSRSRPTRSTRSGARRPRRRALRSTRCSRAGGASAKSPSCSRRADSASGANSTLAPPPGRRAAKPRLTSS